MCLVLLRLLVVWASLEEVLHYVWIARSFPRRIFLFRKIPKNVYLPNKRLFLSKPHQ